MRVKGLKRGFGVCLAFVLSAAMAIPGAAVDTFAAEVEDSILEPESSTVYNLNSTVKLSDLPNKPIVLTGDATIELDADGSVPMIVELLEHAPDIYDPVGGSYEQCNYTLTIKGNKTLKTGCIGCKNLIIQSGTIEINRTSGMKFKENDIYTPAICASGTMTVNDGKVLATAEQGFCVQINNYLQKGGEVEYNGAKGHAIAINGTGEISGGTIKAIGFDYGIMSEAEAVKISGEKTEVYAKATGNGDEKSAITSVGGITIEKPLEIITPAGAKIADNKFGFAKTVCDKDGKEAIEVLIKNPSAVDDDKKDDDKKDDDKKDDDKKDDKKEDDKKTDEPESAVDVEKVNDFVNDLYKKVLGRDPASAEVKGWSDQVADGSISYANLVVGFLHSPEFANKEATDAQFVTSLYEIVLGRTPKDEEVKGWTDAIAGGMSRDEVMSGFVNSEEASNGAAAMGIPQGKLMPDGSVHYNKGINDFVTRCYSVVLNRKGEKGGIDDWTERIYNKQETPEQVINGFINSEEFTNRGLDDDAFIEVLYQTFFGRASDAAGKADWLKQLKDGKKRHEILPGFANSQEFAELLAKYGL